GGWMHVRGAGGGQNYRRGAPTHRARARSGGDGHRMQERGPSGTSTLGLRISDRVKLGFVANLARPGGNITGITHDAQIGDATYTITWVPTSTTRPVGIWKNSLASLALRASPMNSRSCQRGMPECLAGLSARRDRKNDVDMISKCKPCLRATASAWGTFGVSM